MSDPIFDWGFTAVDEQELEAVQQATVAVQETNQTAAELQEKIDKMYNAVQPLLSNLKKNPAKAYIYWPDREAKVDQFEDYLRKIYQS